MKNILCLENLLPQELPATLHIQSVALIPGFPLEMYLSSMPLTSQRHDGVSGGQPPEQMLQEPGVGVVEKIQISAILVKSSPRDRRRQKSAPLLPRARSLKPLKAAFYRKIQRQESDFYRSCWDDCSMSGYLVFIYHTTVTKSARPHQPFIS